VTIAFLDHEIKRLKLPRITT